jgi:UDP-glucose 4-epimerase
MRIIISGGFGHIGASLIKQLIKIKKIKKILVIDNFVGEKVYPLFSIKNKKIKVLYEDLTTYQLDKHLNYDLFIHLAAITNAEKSFEAKNMIEKNYDITKKVVNFCKKNKIKLIFPSSTSVYGTSKRIVFENDNSTLNPQSPYAKIKIKEENLIKKYQKDLKFLIFRLGTIYGFSEGIRFHTAINKFCFLAAFNKELTIWKKNFNQYRPYLCLNDFVRLVISIINKEINIKYNDTYNVLTHNFRLNQIVDILRGIKPNIKIKFVKSPLINQKTYLVSNEKIKKTTFRFTGNLEKSIIKTLNKLI